MNKTGIFQLLYKKRHRTVPEIRESFQPAGLSPINLPNRLEINRDFEIKKKALFKKAGKTDQVQLANYMNMGYYLITPLLLGVFFGLGLDNLFKTKPFFVLLLIFLGLLGTFYNLWRLIKEIK